MDYVIRSIGDDSVLYAPAGGDLYREAVRITKPPGIRGLRFERKAFIHGWPGVTPTKTTLSVPDATPTNIFGGTKTPRRAYEIFNRILAEAGLPAITTMRSWHEGEPFPPDQTETPVDTRRVEAREARKAAKAVRRINGTAPGTLYWHFDQLPTMAAVSLLRRSEVAPGDAHVAHYPDVVPVHPGLYLVSIESRSGRNAGYRFDELAGPPEIVRFLNADIRGRYTPELSTIEVNGALQFLMKLLVPELTGWNVHQGQVYGASSDELDHYEVQRRMRVVGTPPLNALRALDARVGVVGAGASASAREPRAEGREPRAPRPPREGQESWESPKYGTVRVTPGEWANLSAVKGLRADGAIGPVRYGYNAAEGRWARKQAPPDDLLGEAIARGFGPLFGREAVEDDDDPIEGEDEGDDTGFEDAIPDADVVESPPPRVVPSSWQVVQGRGGNEPQHPSGWGPTVNLLTTMLGWRASASDGAEIQVVDPKKRGGDLNPEGYTILSLAVRGKELVAERGDGEVAVRVPWDVPEGTTPSVSIMLRAHRIDMAVRAKYATGLVGQKLRGDSEILWRLADGSVIREASTTAPGTTAPRLLIKMGLEYRILASGGFTTIRLLGPDDLRRGPYTIVWDTPLPLGAGESYYTDLYKRLQTGDAPAPAAVTPSAANINPGIDVFIDWLDMQRIPRADILGEKVAVGLMNFVDHIRRTLRGRELFPVCALQRVKLTPAESIEPWLLLRGVVWPSPHEWRVLRPSFQAAKPVALDPVVYMSLPAAVAALNGTTRLRSPPPAGGELKVAPRPKSEKPEWDMISSYSRAQAIEDGLLVEVPPALAKEAGFKVPVAMTNTAWAEAVAWTRDTTGSVEARLWDVLYVLATRIRAFRGGDRLNFEVKVIPNTGRRSPKLVQLVSHSGPGDSGEHVITIMLPGES